MATVDTSFLNAFYPEESLEILNHNHRDYTQQLNIG